MNFKHDHLFKTLVALLLVSFLIFNVSFPVFAQDEKKVNVRVDGQSVNFDVAPYIDSQNRTIVPLRFIGEELGYSFAWDAQTKQVAFAGDGVLIFLTIGKKEATVNGDQVLLDTAAVTRNGRAMVPLRFIVENLGATVQYDTAKNLVNIVTKEGGEMPVTETRTAVVSEDGVNIRSGPGQTYKVISQANKGNTFKILGQSNDWYQIEITGNSSGWIAGWLVSVRTDSSLPSRSEEPGEGRDPPVTSQPGPLASITEVSVDTSQGDPLLTVTGDQTLNYATSILDNPRRLVLDFFNAVLDTEEIESEDLEVDTELVDGVRMAQFSDNQVRIVVDVSGPAGLTLASGSGKTLSFKIGKPTLQGKTIVIDPGHASIQPGGWADPGAVGPTNLKEKDVVLDMGVSVAEILKAQGAKVIMTRTGDTNLTLGGRADVANKNKADIFVSIHVNANVSRTTNGTSTYFFGDVAGQYQAREKLAKSVQQELVKSIQRKNIGVLQANFAVLRYTQVPSILVETAFISNYEEEKLLADPAFRLKVAQGIANGIERYFLN
ncbi:N-acetylmuramoyl-L-alanine amidase [Candidatus Formimonas warabiya]|uniref:SH3b domain-containing protein n=1 Tax=Formimonas warabiya TaxID=1761012 RepID=A0A3G1KNB3_FORW1|nr:N-acetylmuramoyl-L-alanine amidase [Candidatus Formimonas warabiya]ATW23910.1 hypothetical protein DCMF_03055 [Candidatus Formimonas warabiya]